MNMLEEAGDLIGSTIALGGIMVFGTLFTGARDLIGGRND
jgi:hypothetical protein